MMLSPPHEHFWLDVCRPATAFLRALSSGDSAEEPFRALQKAIVRLLWWRQRYRPRDCYLRLEELLRPSVEPSFQAWTAFRPMLADVRVSEWRLPEPAPWVFGKTVLVFGDIPIDGARLMFQRLADRVTDLTPIVFWNTPERVPGLTLWPPDPLIGVPVVGCRRVDALEKAVNSWRKGVS